MKIERAGLPDQSVLRRLLGESPDRIVEGASVVDADIQGATGVGMLLADERGRPILVDAAIADPCDVPFRLVEHMEWFEENRRLFLRAYSGDGVVKVEEPIFVFVAEGFPKSVVRVMGALRVAQVKLLRAEYMLVDGAGAMLLTEERLVEHPRVSPAVTRRVAEANGVAGLGLEEGIETEAVRRLFALFISGVDGLDGRISVDRSNGGLVFRLEDTSLAAVSLSPGSFTVSPGDPLVNPIVVSDRVSLERALNAVVSLFVRERQPGPDGGEPAGLALGVTGRDREELGRIWGGGMEVKKLG